MRNYENWISTQYGPETSYSSCGRTCRADACMELNPREMNSHSRKSVGDSVQIQSLYRHARDGDSESMAVMLSVSESAFMGGAYKCEQCKRQFTTKNGFDRHMKCHKGIFKFFCDICGKGFQDRTSHEGHMNSHMDFRPYICELCQCSFSFQRSCIRHQITCRKRHGLVQKPQ